MNASLRRITEAAPVDCVGRDVVVSDAFGFGPRLLTVPEFATIAEIVNYAIASGRIPEEMRGQIRVLIGGNEVERAFWRMIRPKAGTHISVVCTPLGGGNVWQTVGMVVVMVVAAWVSGGALSGSMLASGTGMSFAAGSSSAMIAAMGVSMVGGIALNALFGQSAKSSTRYTVDGIGNQPLQKNQPVPIIFGTRRVYPPLAATTWQEVNDIDDDGNNYCYLNLLVYWSLGSVGLDNIKIGETPITDYEDYTLQHHQAGSGIFPSVYKRVVRQDTISREIRYSSSTEGWITNRTRTKTTRIGVTLCWPSGLYGMNMKNSIGVNLQLQYRAVGSYTWIDVKPGSTFTVKKKTAKKFYKKYEWTVEEGQYDVRLRRTNSDDWSLSDTDRSKRQTTAYWLHLNSFGDGLPIPNYENISFSALRFRATDQLNGTLDKLNAVVTSVVPKWNNNTFDDRYQLNSRNPAELFHWYATHGYITAQPVGRDEIDMAAIGAWAEKCKANNWNIDWVCESGSMADVLHTLAQAGQGFGAVWEDGLLSVALDDEKSAPVQIFSARNVRNFTGSIMFPDELHAVNVVFSDNTDNYNSQTRTVYAAGYNVHNATKVETLQLDYKCDPNEAYIFGWRYIAARTLRPETYTFDVWTEGLALRYGQRCDVAHWRMSVGIQGSRVRGYSVNGDGLVVAVTIDDAVTMVAGTSYVLRVKNGSTVSDYTIVTAAGSSSTLELETPVTVAAFGTAQNHCIFGVAEKVTLAAIAVGIEPHADKTVTLTCIPYAPDLLANGGTIPEWDAEITSRATTKTSSGRALSTADQEALNDALAIQTAASVAVVSGAVEETQAVLDGAIDDFLDMSGFTTLEQLLSLVIDIDANNYDQYQQLVSKLELTSDIASAGITQARTVALSAQEAVADLATTVSVNYSALSALWASEVQARANSELVIVNDITTLTANYQSADATLSSSLAEEAQARASGESALSSKISNLTSSVSANVSAVIEESQARVAADNAMADTITQVSSAVGNLKAGGYLRALSVSTEEGSSATVGLAAVASSGATSATAALILHADSDGSGYAAVQAGYFYVLTPDGKKTAVFDKDGVLNVRKLTVQGTLSASVMQINGMYSWAGDNFATIKTIGSTKGEDATNALKFVTSPEIAVSSEGFVAMCVTGLISVLPNVKNDVGAILAMDIDRYDVSTGKWTYTASQYGQIIGTVTASIGSRQYISICGWFMDPKPPGTTVRYRARVYVFSANGTPALEVKNEASTILVQQMW